MADFGVFASCLLNQFALACTELQVSRWIGFNPLFMDNLGKAFRIVIPRCSWEGQGFVLVLAQKVAPKLLCGPQDRWAGASMRLNSLRCVKML